MLLVLYVAFSIISAFVAKLMVYWQPNHQLDHQSCLFARSNFMQPLLLPVPERVFVGFPEGPTWLENQLAIGQTSRCHHDFFHVELDVIRLPSGELLVEMPTNWRAHLFSRFLQVSFQKPLRTHRGPPRWWPPRVPRAVCKSRGRHPAIPAGHSCWATNSTGAVECHGGWAASCLFFVG